MRCRILFAVVSLLVPILTAGQSHFLASPEDTRKAAEAIVASVAAGNHAVAFKELRPLSVIQSTDFDVFEAQINSQQANLLRQFGTATGYEFIREDKLGTRLLRQEFLVFHEKAPLRWRFVFYKAEKGWVLPHFYFDGNALTFFGAGG